MLTKLNLKLVSTAPDSASAPGPVPHAAATPNVRVATATSGASSGSTAAPSGLTAALATDGNYDSGNDFHWDGDELGVEYISTLNSSAVYSPVLFSRLGCRYLRNFRRAYSTVCSHTCTVIPRLAQSPFHLIRFDD